MKSKEWLKRSPIIRFNQIVRKLKNSAYSRVFVLRMIKKGILRRVTKGIYTSSTDIFQIASNIHYPTYLSFLSASHHYGLSEIIPRKIQLASSKKYKTIEFDGYSIEFIPINAVWGYHKEGEGKEALFVADIEKLMVDAFLRPKCMGNFAEIENVFRNVQEVDQKKLKEYLIRLNSNKIYRQVGFMLEKHKGMDIHGIIPMDSNYHESNPFTKGKNTNLRWRLKI